MTGTIEGAKDKVTIHYLTEHPELLVSGICLAALLLDFLLGDPSWLTHPVVIIGKGISMMERDLRRLFPKDERGERAAGTAMAVAIPLMTLVVAGVMLLMGYFIHTGIWVALELLWCWQCLAAKGLRKESMNVYHKLVPEQDLPAAREAVGRIVGRDTGDLSAEGVTKAAVETVAENYSDGVAAPLFYMAVGGAPLALMYKAINTMDSMVGYKNEKYINFGRAAARLDDVANYLPARLAALLWICAAALTGHDAKGSWRIWKRDRRNHASPNSAQTESACAGSLGIQLAGNAYYFGELYEKPTIGDPDRPIEPEDIRRTNRMMYVASVLACLLFAGIRLLIMMALDGLL